MEPGVGPPGEAEREQTLWTAKIVAWMKRGEIQGFWGRISRITLRFIQATELSVFGPDKTRS